MQTTCSLLDDDIYGRRGNDYLYGSSGNDRLYGGAGDDFLFGDDGDDILYGASYTTGDDAGTLRGDAGFDTLRMDYGHTNAWLQFGQGYDTLKFFEEDTDMLFIDLSEFGLGGSLESSEITNSNSVTAVGTNAQFIYEDDTGFLWFDQNGSNAGGLTLIAEFDSSTVKDNNLGVNDFEFQV